MEKVRALSLNLFGGPGVGKSTTAAAVFALLKLHDVECELITEFAKDLVWEERYKTFENQLYIFGKQYHRMWRVQNKVDVMITDCPLLLSTVYKPDNYLPGFERNVIGAIESFNNLNIVLTRTRKYNPNGRNETEDQAKEVDRKVYNKLKENKMSWVDVPGNFEGINTVAKKVLKELGKEFSFKVTC